MKITFDWLKDHLQTKNSENQLLDKLTDIGLEVEGIEKSSFELDSFKVAKIVKKTFLYTSFWIHMFIMYSLFLRTFLKSVF